MRSPGVPAAGPPSKPRLPGRRESKSQSSSRKAIQRMPVFHPERQSQGHRHLQTEQKWLPLFRSLAQVIVRCNAVEIDSQIERFYWRRFRGRCGSKSGYKADTGTNRDQWADPLARRTWATSQSEEQDKQAILPWCGQQARGTASPAFSAISNRSIFDSRKR